MTSSWSPPFCTSRNCPNSHPVLPNWARKDGHFITKSRGIVQRFRCPLCEKHLSRATYRIEFRAKRCTDLHAIAHGINSGQGVRTLARQLGLRPETILNRIARIARQAIGIQVEARNHLTSTENLVSDGLVSYTWSQYFPSNYTGLWGALSQFCHTVDYAVQRRCGRMTSGQRKRRDQLDASCSFPRGSLSASFQRVYNHALSLASSHTRTLHTDEHKTYARIVARMSGKLSLPSDITLQPPDTKPAAGTPQPHDSIHRQSELWPQTQLRHHVTSSRASRTLSNPLMAANYFDREIRKDCANHTRETVQWSRDANNAMARMYLYVVEHNFLKPYRIKPKHERRTHGEVAGVSVDFCKTVRQKLFGTRYFFSRIEADMLPSEQKTWRCEWPNPHKSGVFKSASTKLWPAVLA